MEERTLFIQTNTPYRGGTLLKPLIKLRGHKCESCGLSEWLNQPITLQVHHIDGDRKNNTLENLQLLCPNCHSLTDNFGSKNIKVSRTDEEIIEAFKAHSSIRQTLFSLGMSDGSANYARVKRIITKQDLAKPKEKLEDTVCIKCGIPISLGSTYCFKCFPKTRRTVERPSREELKKMIRSNSFIQIGNQYGVSDNAIRKWCKVYNLPSTKKEINNYSDEEQANI